MKLSSLSKSELKQSLGNHLGIKLKIGGFHICLTSSIDNVAQHLINLYGDYELLQDVDFIDFYVELNAPSPVRRLLRPQVSFSFDGHVPFKPLPYDQAAAMFEWGLNWCIANHSNQYLIIHAAVVERNGQAFIFPGTPGSGKSTLCAALVLSGWRLLSDEMTLISAVDGMVHPVPRPVSLKNQSINVIQRFFDQAYIGHIVNDTAKGTVGHLRPPNSSIEQSNVPAKPSKLIFPKYKEGSNTQLLELSKGKSMMRAAEDCFNYNVLGSQGFDVLGNLIDQCDCYTFEYSQLTEAIQLFTQLTD